MAASASSSMKEAFADLLKKHKQPVRLMASLKESIGAQKRRRDKNRPSPDGEKTASDRMHARTG